MSTIKKAVFPVAGIGTRFLPATKVTPKEMFPIIDKPLIQYAVEEALRAGITELIFVNSGNKRIIEDHFDTNFELETHLENRHQNTILQMIRDILPNRVSCIYVRQPVPLGLGHAILCAEAAVNDQPFAVLLADDLIDDCGYPHPLSQMINTFMTHQKSVIAVQEVADEEVSRYGIVDLELDLKLRAIIEKPTLAQAPSRLGVIGRYVLTPSIFNQLRQTRPDKKDEIQLTDAIAALLLREPVYAWMFQGHRYDCGDKLGYLKALIDTGLKRSDLSKPLKEYLHEIFKSA